MKTLQNNFTTPEQSKRLLELGVPADSADMYYKHTMLAPYTLSDGVLFSVYSKVEDIIPCWSVGRLIKILKVCVTNRNELNEIFDELEMCIDETAVLVQTFKEYSDVIDFSKLEE